MREIEDDINYSDIKLQINSILDIIKKPNTIPIKQLNNMIPLLLDHQKQNIQWMINLENNVDNGDTINLYNYSPHHIKLHNQIVFSSYTNRFQFHIPKKYHLSYQGGILADQMGIGKSLTCIGLMMQKTREPRKIKNKYYARANLVLCPSHLVQQWFDEIVNNTIGLKVCMIRTKKDLELLSYQDLITCNVVIISYQFLHNQQNQMLLRPLLEIQWHRIFLDEGHEIVFNNRLFNQILKFKSTYKWYVSGTPFIDSNIMNFSDYCVYRIALFLGIIVKQSELVAPYSVNSIKPNLEFMKEITKLMIRNTKESANIQLPSVKINDKLLEFHKTERGRYDIAKSRPRTTRRWLLQLCCSMNLADQDLKEFGAEKTLEQIHEIMIENQEIILRKKKTTLQNTIPKREETIITLEKQEIIERLTKEIKQIESSLIYLKSVLNQITNEQTCPICFDVIEDLAITNICGHIFCINCIEKCFHHHNKCPTCRTLTDYMTISNNCTQKESNDRINKYGTKITQLLDFLNKHKDEKILIFSQWDKLLHQIGDILNSENFSNAFCQGSIFQRNKCLVDFRKKNIQILMMSLHYAVSGTNLTEASQVVILDIFNGTSEDIQKIEAQAIGRVHRLGQNKPITITRFIMKNTIEEDLYKKMISNTNTNTTNVQNEQIYNMDETFAII